MSHLANQDLYGPFCRVGCQFQRSLGNLNFIPPLLKMKALFPMASSIGIAVFPMLGSISGAAYKG
uniref:Uncharacterized protein n=1 Tax=Mus musculus TaxID=10090 RepID=Q3TRF5_MOUSE|nr:unnamed protein product [Mus musculus]